MDPVKIDLADLVSCADFSEIVYTAEAPAFITVAVFHDAVVDKLPNAAFKSITQLMPHYYGDTPVYPYEAPKSKTGSHSSKKCHRLRDRNRPLQTAQNLVLAGASAGEWN